MSDHSAIRQTGTDLRMEKAENDLAKRECDAAPAGPTKEQAEIAARCASHAVALGQMQAAALAAQAERDRLANEKGNILAALTAVSVTVTEWRQGLCPDAHAAMEVIEEIVTATDDEATP